MSLVPHPHHGGMFRRAWDDLDWHNQNVLKNQYYYNNWSPERAYIVESPHEEVVNTKEKFAVEIDVSQFRPDEVKVSITGRELSVEGHHEERNDLHGSIQRSFTRKYTLPDDVNLDAINSAFSSDGKLSIEAPKMVKGGPQSRTIPITHSKI